MTKLVRSGVRPPLRHLTEEEASTYRRWARVWYAALFIALAVIVAADLAREGEKDGAITLEAIP
jgi:hypothetical protein